MAPSLRRLTRRRRPWRQRLSVARAEFYAELLLCAAALTLLLTGGRARWLERLWSHADAAAAVLCVVLFVLLHSFVTRRVVPFVARRYSPTPYDERRILFDLSQEARTAKTAGLSVDEIRDELVRRVASWSAGAPQHDDLTFVVMKVR
jgi:hypothetical protein